MPFPSPADDYKERPLSLDDLCVVHPISTFFVRAGGDAMIGACIHPGDVLVVDRALTATRGAIVVVRVGKHMAIRRLIINKEGLFLQAANPKYLTVNVTTHPDFEIWGVVTYVVHKLARSQKKDEST